jgi:hypothetical protein
MSPKVREQTAELWREFPQFKTGYGTFMQDYSKASPIQKSRETMQDLTGVLSDIGSVLLPPVTGALRDFATTLQTIKGILPVAPGKDKENVWGKVGAAAIEWGAGGAALGSFVPGVGTIAGGLGGAALGGGLKAFQIFTGLEESVSVAKKTADAGASAVSNLSAAIESLSSAARSFMNFGTQSLHPGSVPPPPASGGTPGKQGSIYLDGRKVGQLITGRMADRASQPLEGSPYYDQTHGVPAQDFAWSNG